MIELIIVIVVAGILAAVMLPRLERDAAREAAEQVAKHIRYTQHLAMVNDVYDGSSDWYQDRWSINLCSKQYRISRANYTTDENDIAVDPLSQEPIDGSITDAFDLAKRFGITDDPLASNCIITFDNLGRAYRTSSLPTTLPSTDPATTDIMDDVNITITDGSKSYKITVTGQTGYTFVNY